MTTHGGMSPAPGAGAHGHSSPGACSVGHALAGTSAYGTAPQARFWLALEQSGPWGRDAAVESHLPVAVGRRLTQECARLGGRFALLRRPGTHPDRHRPGGRTAYLAFCGSARTAPWLLAVRLHSAEEALALDLTALARGALDDSAAHAPEARTSPPVLLVCTNGRRDVCCAVRGRPVALGAGAVHPGRVWEASHTGGHRFAPTGVLLPHGRVLARLDGPLAAAVLDEAERGHLPAAALGPVHDRGWSALLPVAQAAESHVRAQTRETSLTTLLAQELAGEHAPTPLVRVEHADGRHWTVALERREKGLPLPDSCGRSPIPVQQWEPLLR